MTSPVPQAEGTSSIASPGSLVAEHVASLAPAAPASADTPTGKSPTSQQWLQSSLRLISLLLDHGASLLVRDEGGASALELAVGAPSVERLIHERLPQQVEAEAWAQQEKARPAAAAADKKDKPGAVTQAAADIKLEIVGGDAKAPSAVGGGCCLVT